MNTSPNALWFYAQSDERTGPIPFSDLQRLIEQGLPQSCLVWTEGMEQWIPASNVPALQAITPANPYASPGAPALAHEAPTGSGLDLPIQPIPLDIGYCIGQGWKYTLANFGQIFLLGLVYFLISFAISAVVEGVSAEAPAFIAIIVGLLQTAISIFLSLGLVRFGHRLLDGENPPIGELFSQGSKLVPAILASILFYLMVIVGMFLFIIPGIYLAIRFGFFTQAIVEKGLGPIESLKYSWNLTKQNGLSLFGFYVLSILIIFAGALLILVGLLWAIPTTWLALLIAFRYLHRGPNAVKILP